MPTTIPFLRENWREIINASSQDELELLEDGARMYDDVIDLLVPPMHAQAEIVAARRGLENAMSPGQTVASHYFIDTDCVKVMMQRTSLSKDLCEAFVDCEAAALMDAGLVGLCCNCAE